MCNTVFIKDKTFCMKTVKNKAGSYTKIKTMKDSKELQVICRSSQLLMCVLPKLTNTSQIHILLINERQTLHVD